MYSVSRYAWGAIDFLHNTEHTSEQCVSFLYNPIFTKNLCIFINCWEVFPSTFYRSSCFILQTGDTTAPVISGCPASIFTNAGTQSFSTVTWTAPTATDESGVVFQTFASHQPGQQFPVGATPVTYVFSDLSQNYARCVFFVTVSSKFFCLFFGRTRLKFFYGRVFKSIKW